ncbi:MAG TPA: hypothetical protein VGG30_10000 [Pirellulales bacterium]|jgi:hypothetical protein
MRRTLILGALCAGLSWPALSSRALAERETSVKPLGDAYYFYAAKTYGNHAADHVLLLRQFVSTNRLMPTGWVRRQLDAVRGHATSTSWAYAQLSPRITDDPAGAEQLGEIQEQYAEVLEICDRLDAAFAAPGVDLVAMSRTVDQLQSSLSGARVTQQNLAVEFGGDQ